MGALLASVAKYRRAAHAENTHSSYATAARRYTNFGDMYAICDLYPYQVAGYVEKRCSFPLPPAVREGPAAPARTHGPSSSCLNVGKLKPRASGRMGCPAQDEHVLEAGVSRYTAGLGVSSH
eukprot:CAMPEP_0198197452 /NCGR_PEP_ID=MMETSP1445-20131203/1073_1 /TAXON_ID=36898 /ORGANISM="Pyramimonas sp., Strain CCMP2087" /LENGTH=121 /DNA_ID=CAMNT_0043866749 /DNA_START=129 /DNA_END=491 /DNA_ORIENTATION=-